MRVKPAMSMDDRRLLEALLRTELIFFTRKVFAELHPGRTFTENWHQEAMAYWLHVTAVTGEIKRLVVNVPPRSLKSIMISVALSAYLLGRDPTKKIIVVSYNQDLAADFSRKTRQVMQSIWYRQLFPSTRIVERGRRAHSIPPRAGSVWQLQSKAH